MRREGADRFVNCVLKRSQSDGIIRIEGLLLVTLAVPLLLILIMRFINSDEPLSGVTLINMQLFMGIIATFIAFRLIYNLNKHQKRDIEWADGLTDYAESYGHDVSKLRKIRNKFGDNRVEEASKIFLGLFIAVMVINSFMAFFTGISQLDSRYVLAAEIIISALIFLEFLVVSVYLFRAVKKHDSIQRNFTKEFCSVMSSDLPEAVPMDTRIRYRILWPHIVLFFMTLGFYSLFFILGVIHLSNMHVARQWTYEEDMVKLIMEKEGAIGIEKIDRDYGTGFMKIVRRIFF